MESWTNGDTVDVYEKRKQTKLERRGLDDQWESDSSPLHPVLGTLTRAILLSRPPPPRMGGASLQQWEG